MNEQHEELIEEQESVTAAYDIDKVKHGIEKLAEGYRMVLSLYLMEGYDHKEIAQILDITVSTSKSQLNRSKKRLKEILKEDLQHAG